MSNDTGCEFGSRLTAYHDGELDAAAREALAAHLAGRGKCRAELAALAGVSGVFAQVPRPRLLPIAAQRIQRNVEMAMQRSLLRLARIFSAAAACILLAGSIQLYHWRQAASSAPLSSWTEVAASSAEARDASSPAVQWYLADASRSTEDIP